MNEKSNEVQHVFFVNSFADPEPATPTFPTWTESRKVYDCPFKSSSAESVQLSQDKEPKRLAAQPHWKMQALRQFLKRTRSSPRENDPLSQSRCKCVAF